MSDSGVGVSGTHRNLENLSTAGNRVPAKFQKLSTAGLPGTETGPFFGEPGIPHNGNKGA